MTIELITGTPGAGKTCYAVSKRIVPEFGRTVVVEREGGGDDLVERRIIVAGIRGLVVNHDRLPHTLTGERVAAKDVEFWNECDSDGEPLFKRLPGDPAHVVEASLFNWWLWCRPGDLIVCDEVQFIIPRGTLGKSPPHYIKSLEIHRHYGVDFLFITQSPQLLDTTIRNLVGLHRHVRSVIGSPLCLVYEWDHASNTERITGSSKRWYYRKKRYFKLYKSTVAVVSPPKSGRFAFGAVPVLALVFSVLLYTFLGRFKHRGEAVAATTVSAPAAPGALGQAGQARAQLLPIQKAIPELAKYSRMSGCYATPQICGCIDQAGRTVQVERWVCEQSARGFEGLVAWEPRKPQDAASAPAYGAAAGSSTSPAKTPS